MTKKAKKKKPSEIIREKAQKIHGKGIDPHFNGNVPTIGDYLEAVIEFLDAKWKQF